MWEFLLTHTPLLYLTQSIWRDEAFSILASQKPIPFLIQNLSFEPPLYYILFHYWMLVVGDGEITGRLFSFLPFAASVVLIIFWAEKLFRKSWLSWYLPLFFFLNPMLLYYAFEIRTYGWFILFTVLSLYWYTEEKWKLWALATVLGFYTHAYFIFVPFTQVIHYALIHKNALRSLSVRKLLDNSFVTSSILSLLVMAPWLLKIVIDAQKLKTSWYYPVDTQLVKAALGNLFTGFEGTPWYGWNYMTVLSIGILLTTLYTLRDKINRRRNLLFFLLCFLPLIIVIGVSFFKPLYVNRYVIPVAIAEVFLITFALSQIRNKIVAMTLGIIWLGIACAVNLWFPAQHAKYAIRPLIEEVETIRTSTDLIYVENPLIYFETLYYATDPSTVHYYNPSHTPFPWYVGEILAPTTNMVYDYPLYPKRAILVKEDGTYTISFRIDNGNVDDMYESQTTE